MHMSREPQTTADIKCGQVTWNVGSAAAEGGSDPVHAWCALSSGALLARHAKLLIQYAADPLVPLGVVMELPGACGFGCVWVPVSAAASCSQGW